MPGLNDFATLYAQQINPYNGGGEDDAQPSGGGGLGFDPQAVANQVDKNLDQEAKDQQTGFQKAATAYQKNNLEQMREQGLTPIHNDDGSVSPLTSAAGQPLRKIFGTGLFSDTDGNLHQPDYQNGGTKPAEFKTRTDSSGNILNDYGRGVTRVVGQDPEFQRRQAQGAVLDNAEVALRKEQADLATNNPLPAANKAIGDAQRAINSAKRQKIDVSTDPDDQKTWQGLQQNLATAQQQKDATQDYVNRRAANGVLRNTLADSRRMAKSGTLGDDSLSQFQTVIDNQKIKEEGDADPQSQGEGAPQAQDAAPEGAPAQPGAPAAAAPAPNIPGTPAAPIASGTPPPQSVSPGSSGQAASQNAAAGSGGATSVNSLPPAGATPSQPTPAAAPAPPPPPTPEPPKNIAPAPKPEDIPVADASQIGAMDVDSAKNYLAQSEQGLKAREAALQQKQTQALQPRVIAQQNLQQWESTNAASVQNGDPTSEMQYQDGTPKVVANHLKGQLQQYTKDATDAEQKVKANLDALQPDQDELEDGYSLHNQAVQALNDKVTASNTTAEATRIANVKAARDQMRAGGLDYEAGRLDQIDQTHANLLNDLDERLSSAGVAPDSDEAKAAHAQIDQEMDGKRQEIADLVKNQQMRHDRIQAGQELLTATETREKAVNDAQSSVEDADPMGTMGAVQAMSDARKQEAATRAAAMQKAGITDPDDAAALEKMAKESNYRMTPDGKITFTPDKMLAGFDNAVSDGMVSDQWADAHRADFAKAQKAYDDLVKVAGDDATAKAVLHGGGIGLAAASAAGVGARVTASAVSKIPFVGQNPYVVGGAAIIGGLVAGGMAAKAASAAVNKAGDYWDTMKSVNAAAQLHPEADATGQFIGMALAPEGAMNPSAWKQGLGAALTPGSVNAMKNVAGLARTAYDSGGTANAITQVGKVLGGGALTGAAFEGVVRPAFDATVIAAKKMIGIDTDEKVQPPTVTSLIQNAALGALVAGHNIKFQDFDHTDVASILVRQKVRSAAGIDPMANVSTDDMVQAFRKQGVELTNENAAAMAKPLTPQEFAVYNAVRDKAAQLQKTGAFDGVSPTDLTFRARQAQVGTIRGPGTPITSAAIDIPGKGGSGESKSTASPVEPPAPAPANLPAPPPKTAESEGIIRSATQKGSDTELSKLGTTDPESAHRFDVLRRVASGEDLSTMPVEDLNAVGLDRGTGGNITPMKGIAGKPDVYFAKNGGKSNPIITDSAISQMKTAAPLTGSLVNMSEGEALNHFQRQATAEPEAQTPKNAETAPKTGASGEENAPTAENLTPEAAKEKAQQLDAAADHLEEGGKSHNVTPLRDEAAALREQAKKTKPQTLPKSVSVPKGSNVVGEPGFRITDEAAGKAYSDKGGWKLHLAVDPKNYAAVDGWLAKNHKGGYKLLTGGDPGESDFTVYVGSKEAAAKMATKMKAKIGGMLNPTAYGKSDLTFNDKVSGRFDVQHTGGPNKVPWRYYGRNGIPFDEDASSSVLRSPDGDPELESHLGRLNRELTERYGRHFTGTDVPQKTPVKIQPEQKPQKEQVLPPSDASVPQISEPVKGSPADALKDWGKKHVSDLALQNPRVAAKAAGHLAIIGKALEAYGKAFDGMEIGSKGPGVQIDPNNGNLQLNPVKMLEQMSQMGSAAEVRKALALLMDEEFKHKATMVAENRSPQFAEKLHNFWNLLPERLKTDSSNAYFRNESGKFSSDWHACHEFLRQYWQAKTIRRITEQAMVEVGKIPALVGMVDSYVDALREIEDGMHPDVKKALDELLAVAEEEAQALRDGHRPEAVAATPAPAKPTPEAKANAPPETITAPAYQKMPEKSTNVNGKRLDLYRGEKTGGMLRQTDIASGKVLSEDHLEGWGLAKRKFDEAIVAAKTKALPREEQRAAAIAEAETPEGSKSSTQLTLSPDQAKPFIEFGKSIPDSELYGDLDPSWSDDAREQEPHVTTLFGLHDPDSSEAARLIQKAEPITVTLGKTSLFHGDKYDVLKVDVSGTDLHALNKKLQELPNTNTYPDYKPHITIAYLKKGEGDKYAGDTRFEGQKITFGSLTYSPPSKVRDTFGRPEIPFKAPVVPKTSTATAPADQNSAKTAAAAEKLKALLNKRPLAQPSMKPADKPDAEQIAAMTDFADGIMEQGDKEPAAFAKAVMEGLGPDLTTSKMLSRIWTLSSAFDGDAPVPVWKDVLASIAQPAQKPVANEQKGSTPVPPTDEPNLVQRPESAESGNAPAPAVAPKPGGDKSGGRVGSNKPAATPAVGSGGNTSPAGQGSGKPGSGSAGPSVSGRPESPEPNGSEQPVRRPKPRTGVAAGNYHITDADEIGKGGQKTKFKQNIAAIKLAKQITAENRPATVEEQRQLVKYVGWGGMKAAFNENSNDWKKEFPELKALLTPDEYEAARRSVLDAHYTSPEVIQHGLWAALQRFGFNGGKMVEGGVGVGHIIGLMPAAMRNTSSYLGIEKDPITAQIAQLLYPQASIHNTGFEESNLSRDTFDATAGNPPFGQQRLADKNFPKEGRFSIHNFFIAKTLATLRPGGVAAFVVSHNFLDAADGSARDHISERAEFLGGIRLPNTAFKGNANTDVTTDLVFFKRLPEGAKSNQNGEWRYITTIKDEGSGKPIKINSWMAANPQMMLGKMTLGGSMYGPDEPTLAPIAGQNIADELDKAVSRLPKGIYAPADPERLSTPNPVTSPQKAEGTIPGHVKVGAFYEGDDGKLFRRLPDVNMEQVREPATGLKAGVEDRIRAILPIRDTLNALVRAEMDDNFTDAGLATMRKRLNEAYDAFTNKFGYLNSQSNRRAFYDDPESQRILGLERDYDPGVSAQVAKKKAMEKREPSAAKAAIFTRRVNTPFKEITSVQTPTEALAVSMNQRGKVDMPYMAELMGADVATVLKGLEGFVYQDPTEGWQTKEQYLSGNVRNKLAEAQDAAAENPDFRPNVDALKKAVPKDIPALEIVAPVGAPWVAPKDISDFCRELTGQGPRSIAYIPANGGWMFDHMGDGVEATRTWGTPRMYFGDLMKAMLNGKPIVVYDVDRDGKRWFNQTETQLAAAKADEIREKWGNWLWDNQERRQRLARVYNDRYNNYVDPHYDGSHLTLPGISPDITLRQHQKNVIWRTMTDMNVLYDHVVGAGKTFAGIGSFMELKRTGRVRKPLFAVPNHLVTQWRDDFVRLYPNANVLFAQPSDFQKDNRGKLFGKVLTGEYDAIIIGHSSFKKIGVSPKVERELLNEMLGEIVEAIRQMKEALGKGGSTRQIAQMERTKESIQQKIKNLANRAGERDQTATFEELGIDGLFVDEAHEFKNLFYTTQMQNVAGMGSPAGSSKAFDLYLKTRYMRKRYGGKSPTVFATGTPISNSLVEMFTMQRYLQPKVLEEMGLTTLDAWARVFADVKGVYEVDPTGTGYRMKTRLANFQNVGELSAIYRSFADVVTMTDLKAQAAAAGTKFPVPKVQGGKPTNVVVDRSQLQESYFGVEQPVMHGDVPATDHEGNPITTYPEGTICWRVDHMPTDAREDNMLKLTNDARRAGLDMRLINPSLPDNPGSKINEAVKKIVATYHQWHGDKGTQLVFCDLSIPASARGKAKAKHDERTKNLYFRRTPAGLELVKPKDAKPVDIDGPKGAKFFGTKINNVWHIIEKGSGMSVGNGAFLENATERAAANLQKAGNFDQVMAEHRPTDEEVADLLDQHAQAAAEAEDEDEESGATPAEEEQGGNLDELLAESSSFSVYDDMKAKLIAAGIPENEIAFIHDYDTPDKKAKLFASMNSGSMRVLFGSTQKMGAGTNAQRRLVALHHMDAPWRPSDLEQREGRIVRQGNALYERDPDGFEVFIGRYATRQTYDTRMWQIIEHKANGIEGFRLADRATRTIQDIGGEAANAGEMKAAASGDPLIQREIELRNEKGKLDTLKRGWQRTRHDLQEKISYLDRAPERESAAIAEAKRLIKWRDDHTPKGFEFSTAGGKELTEKKGISDVFKHAFTTTQAVGNPVSVGAYRGFRIAVNPGWSKGSTHITAVPTQGNDKPKDVTTYYADDTIDDVGVVRRLDNYLATFETDIENAQDRRKQDDSEMEKARAQVDKPFAHEKELEALNKEHVDVRSKLMANRAARAPQRPPDDDTPLKAPPAEGASSGSFGDDEIAAAIRRMYGDLDDYTPTPEEVAELKSLLQDTEAGRAMYHAGTTVPEIPPHAVGTRNAFTDLMRERKGFLPRFKQAARSFGTVWDEAMREIDHNPKVGERLIREINDKPRPLSDTERAILTHEFLVRSQVQDDAADRLNKGDDAERDIARIDLAIARDDYYAAMEAASRAGTATGRALNAIRMAINEDFSLARLEARYRAVNGGKALNEDQEKEIARLHKRIEATQDTLAKYEEEREHLFTREQVEKMVEDARQTPTVITRWRTRYPTVEEMLSHKKDQGLEKLKGLGLSQPPLRGPEVDPRFDALADVGAANYAHGAREYDDWLMSMRNDGIAKLMDDPKAIFEEAKLRAERAFSARMRKNSRIQKPAGVLDEMRDEGGIDPAGIRALAMSHIKAGAVDTAEILKAVKTDLQTVQPGITDREISDAISGYGTAFGPSSDPHKRIMAELASQTRLMSAIDDVLQGRMPLRTGFQPGDPSDKVRELAAQLRQAIKDNPDIQALDPAAQMKSSQDIIMTRLKNRRADLQRQFDAKARDPKSTKKTAYTPEMTEIAKEIKELDAALEQISPRPGMSEEKKIELYAKAVERSIAAMEKMKATNNVAPKAKGTARAVPPEVQARVDYRKALREEIQRMRDALNPKMTPEQRALKALKRRLHASIATNKAREAEIKATGAYTKKAKATPPPMDPEATKLSADAIAAKKDFMRAEHEAFMKGRSLPLKTLTWVAKWGRFVKISGLTVIGKLFLAANIRNVTTPIEDLLAGGLSFVPGISRIAKRSPRHWGFSVGAEAEGLSRAFTGFIKNFGSRMKNGQADWEARMGDKTKDDMYDLDRSILDYVANLHMVLKSPAVEGEFARSFAYRAAYYARQGINIRLPEVQMRLANAAVREAYDTALAAAFEDSKGAKLMRENILSDLYHNGLRWLERTEKIKNKGGPELAQILRVFFPIVKIPSNFAFEAWRYSPPGFLLHTLGWDVGRAVINDISKLPPDQADAIMRHLSKGLLGLALCLIGFFTAKGVYDHFRAGGYYQEHERRRKDEVGAGRFRVGKEGTDVPRWASHTPALEAIQFGATVRRTMDHLTKKTGEHGTAWDATKAGLSGLTDEIPFVSGLKNTLGLLKSGKEGDYQDRNFALNMTVPRFIQEIAEMTDTRGGETIKRDPQDLKDTFKTASPFGQRQEVREKGGPNDEFGYPKDGHQSSKLERTIDNFNKGNPDGKEWKPPALAPVTLDKLPDEKSKDQFQARVNSLQRDIFERTATTYNVENPDKSALQKMKSAHTAARTQAEREFHINKKSTSEDDEP